MIPTNELRIGNLVFFNNQFIPIYEVKNNSVSFYLGLDHKGRIHYQNIYVKGIEPIPITKVWFFKLVVEYNKTCDRFTVFENDAFSLYASFDDINGFQIWFENGFSEYPLNIEYIHQLQNLYFVFTGKELTYNII